MLLEPSVIILRAAQGASAVEPSWRFEVNDDDRTAFLESGLPQEARLMITSINYFLSWKHKLKLKSIQTTFLPLEQRTFSPGETSDCEGLGRGNRTDK